ncbi:MAG TPA: N-acetyltransferase [Clostridia bacterium]|nr:N-acetyltransferase [Clostridia bacterium]
MSDGNTSKGYFIVNLADMLTEIGENATKSILLEFSCPVNSDVEYFIKQKAIEFSRQSLAKTHLVFCSYKSEVVLIGYFSLANKFILVNPDILSNNKRKRITKFGIYNKETKKYIISAPLIAQLGKNFKYKDKRLISGNELLKMACDKVQEAQSYIGGKIVYLECEDKPVLNQFYTDSGFIRFGARELDEDEKGLMSSKQLVQMLKYLD